ncbi:Derepression protein [Pectobacterium aroidearum]|uniref:Derepression protein n=1 Tax=Pectobacterium aroidearum TaxID=1201031 RepID=UPI00301A9996
MDRVTAQALSAKMIAGEETQKNNEVHSLSIESYHKMNRAKNVAFGLHLHVRKLEVNAEPLLWLPDIFSYLHDDIDAVLNELKGKGLCNEWLKQGNGLFR